MFAGFSKLTGLIGIDLGSDRVRMLQVREQRGDLKVISAAMDRAPAINGRPDVEGLATWLRTAAASGGFIGRRCTVALPRDAVSVQSVRLPRMPAAELAQAVEWEASQRFELDRTAIEVDFIRTGASVESSDQREEVLMIAAERERIMPWLDAVVDAGLRPVGAETKFTAIARLFSRQTRRESDRDTVRAVVEVGRSGSTILVLRGDQIAFCKPLSISGERFDCAASEHLGIDVGAAAELRQSRIAAAGGEVGHAANPETDRAIFEAVRPLLNEIAKEVTLSLRYYGVTFRGHPPQQIILTGRDGAEPHLSRVVTESCKIETVFDDQAETLAGLQSGIRKALNRSIGPVGAWIAAAGLSMRNLSAATARRTARDEKGRSAA